MAQFGKQCDKTITYIKNSISQGLFPPDTKLPAENTLAGTLQVSRVTVRRALDQLIEEGIIRREFSRGAFVNPPQTEVQQQIIPFISQFTETGNSRFFDIYSGIQDSFSEHNLRPLLAITGFDPDKERETVLDFVNKGYHYMLILGSFSDKNAAFYYGLMQQGIRFVFLDKKPSLFTADCVVSNNFDGGYQATRHLIAQGHRRIAVYVTQSSESASSTAERINGYRLAMEEHGLWDPSLVIDWASRSAETFAVHLAGLFDDITAVFCLADCFAIPLVNYYQRNKIRMAVIGFDNLKETETNLPSISTVEQQFYQLGYRSADLLYRRLTEPSSPFVTESLPVRLIVRDSTK